MRLNLIGNGFDMYHGLPCSYYYYGCYLLQYHKEFYEEMAKMYGFKYAIITGYEDFKYGIENIFWSSFENRLGNLDATWIRETLDDDLGLECSDPVDIEIPEVANSKEIKKYFNEWISSTVDNDENFMVINKFLGESRFKWKKEDYFINYNYSHTLEKIYKILSNKVFHIHGECGEDSELIVGHGNDGEIMEHKNMLKGMEGSTEYFGYQSDRNRYNEYSCELDILEDLKKDTKRLISDMESKLSSWDKNVSEICVWGLSCGPVDKPYICKLIELYPDVIWSFSYYDTLEKNERQKFVKQLGLKRVNFFKLNNSGSNDIKKILVNRNNIEEFEAI